MRNLAHIVDQREQNAQFSASVSRQRGAPMSAAPDMLAPLQTRYAGYRFRSRLEARWAVFFDHIGAPWEYEPEGYALPDGGGYLPDFRLPESRWLLDVKPKPANFDGTPWIENRTKEQRFADLIWAGYDFPRDGSATTFAVVYGAPGPVRMFESISSYAACIGLDTPYFFCLCPWCGKLGLEFEGRGARVCGWRAHHETEEAALAAIKHLGFGRVDDGCLNYDDPKLLAAFGAARSQRFGT